ncbi:MAG TPA: hypothetical protein VD906_08135 [Caulobacteraceae bacterium]|nr:hypothetical protein [Caulobacteraceae bacterium]
MPGRPRNLLLLLLTFLGLALFAAFVGWAFLAAEDLGGGWSGLRPILPMVIAGLLVVGGLTGGLMWLAFYSSRHGYDEPFDWDDEPPSR